MNDNAILYERKYQVFVSSTYEDLKEERKEVTQALLENDCIPVGMELFPASNKKQWDIIKSVIDSSDYYLLIIAGRYGTCGKDDSGNTMSYTEMEFDYAHKNGKPIIVFLHSDIESLPLSKSERTKIGRQRLRRFMIKVSNGREMTYWTNKDNLKSRVIMAIRATIRDFPSYGWIKVNKDIEDILKNTDDAEKKSFAQIYNELFPVLIDFREYLRKADSRQIKQSVDKLQTIMQCLYYEAERCRYSHKSDSRKAGAIVNKWNDFSVYYNLYVDAQDRMSEDAQNEVKKAEDELLELVDMIAKNL